MNKLDEISRVIGNIEAKIESFGRSLDSDRVVANDRHKENLGNFEQLDGRMENLERTVSPLKEAVAKMEPIFQSVLVSKSRIAGALAVVSGIITIIGGLMWMAMDRVGVWVGSFFHPPT